MSEMKTFAIFGLIALLLFSGCITQPTDNGNNPPPGNGSGEFQLNYEVYGGFVPQELATQVLIINEKGEVRLISKNPQGAITSEKTKTISKQEVADLIALLQSKGFWNMEGNTPEKDGTYTIPPGGPIVADAGNLDLTVSYNGRTKTVSVSPFVEYSMPENLKVITEKIGGYFELFYEPAPELDGISVDKQEYSAGEKIKITIQNNSKESIFFGGCNDFALEKYDEPYVDRPQEWNDMALAVCFWEGIPTKLSPGDSVERTIERELAAGTYRLRLDYATGCAEGKPLSQADCKSFGTSYSGEFTVMRAEANLECNADADCAVGGCSSQVCTTKELAPAVVTTCEYLNEYACLNLAGCGCIQNKCQWGKDKPAYQQCIAELPAPNYPDSQQQPQ
jgi:eight-cysteine-cluster-containing protein